MTFRGAYFDSEGCFVFETEGQYRSCIYLCIGPANTWVRDKRVGMSISDMPGYQKLNPAPRTW